MGAEVLRKKLKKKSKAIKNTSETKSSLLFLTDDGIYEVNGERKKKNSSNKRRNKDKAEQIAELEKAAGGKKKVKLLRNSKRKPDNIEKIESREEEKLDNVMDDRIGEENMGIKEVEVHKRRKLKKKERRNEKKTDLNTKGKGKKASKSENVEHLRSKDEQYLLEKKNDADDEVYRVSSGDEDSTKGMQKWLMEYKQRRPGLKVLQERIDDLVTAHEAQEEQARKEREAQAAEGGWTVVIHHKGRKKTTDSESGIAVGSVAQAAILDKMAKKKNKEIGVDFYRFQKREAHRNENGLNLILNYETSSQPNILKSGAVLSQMHKAIFASTLALGYTPRVDSSSYFFFHLAFFCRDYDVAEQIRAG